MNRVFLSKRFIKIIGVSVLLAFVAPIACNQDTGSSGIRGLVVEKLIGGVFPPPPPIIRPLPNALIIVMPTSGGVEVTRVITDEAGKFEIALKPGAYLLIPRRSPTESFLDAPQQVVFVSEDAFTDVHLEFITPLP